MDIIFDLLHDSDLEVPSPHKREYDRVKIPAVKNYPQLELNMRPTYLPSIISTLYIFPNICDFSQHL